MTGPLRHRADQCGQLRDLDGAVAERVGMVKRVMSRPRERRSFQHPVQQPREVGQDRLVDPVQRAGELAMVVKAHEGDGYHAPFKAL